MDKTEALLKVASALTLIQDVSENYVDDIGTIPDWWLKMNNVPPDGYVPLITKKLQVAAEMMAKAAKLLQCSNKEEYAVMLLQILSEKDGGAIREWRPPWGE